MDYANLSSQALMDLCNAYFLTSEEVNAEKNGTPGFQYRKRDYATYASASKELAKRGREVIEWARRLLTHPDYDARELGATLLGFLGERRELGSREDQIVDDLCKLATRPLNYDGKELQAVSAAIDALGRIGNRRSIATLVKVLSDTSDGDSQWMAADALGKILHVPFAQEEDPVASAQQWLKDNDHSN